MRKIQQTLQQIGKAILLCILVFTSTSILNAQCPAPTGTIGGNTGVLVNSTTTLTVPSLPTGGTITNSGIYRVHTFTSSGTFTVPSGFSGTVEVLVVAGGGGGGGNGGGGGGAGGYVSNSSYTILSGSATTITIGGGGAASVSSFVPASKGGNSVFGTITATGGGGGASRDGGGAALAGGSGGGGAGSIVANTNGQIAGAGTSGQGFAGGSGVVSTSCPSAGGGGGGAASAGTAGVVGTAGNGGAGSTSTISGNSVIYAAGGKGALPCTVYSPAVPSANSGNGGDAGGSGALGVAGASGIVIVRYVNYAIGTWSSSNTAVATVDASGVVTGLRGGTSTISFKTSTCSNASSTLVTAVYADPGNALNFDGSNDYITGTSSFLPLGNTARTIEAWVKPGNTQNGSIFNWGNSTANNRSGILYIGGFLYFVGQNNDLPGTIALPVGKWSHVAATFDGSTLKLYVNGVLDISTGKTLNTSGSTFRIGASSGTLAEYFNGSIDEVRVWNSALTQAQLQTNMLNTVSGSTSGLVAYYNFDNGTPGGTNTGLTTLTDQTSNGRNGTLTNFALTTASGEVSNWVESYAMVVPTADAASSIAITSFTTNWTLPTLGTLDNYLLDVSTNPAFSSFVSGYNGLSVAGTSKSVTGLSSLTPYYYRVRAENANLTGQGGYSATITATTLASTNANLSALTTTAGTVSPSFATAITSYIASVSNATTSVTVTPTVADATATVKVNGTVVSSGTASGAVALAIGSNIITVLVTAQDGTTTNSYKITVNRACITTVSSVSISPASICAATSPLLSTAVTNGGISPQYYWSLNNVAQGIAAFSNKTTSAGLGSNTANGVYVGSDNKIYVATNGGLSISSDGGSSFSNKTTTAGLGSNTVNGVFIGSDNKIYAATNTGLSISSDGGTSFTNKTTSSGLGSSTINGVYVSNDGTIYVASNGGLSISDDGGSSFSNKTTTAGLGSNTVNGVFVGSDNKIYAATNTGLSISTNGGTSFTNKTTSSGLGSNTVNGVYVESDGTIYVATNGGLSISANGGTSFSNKTTSNGLINNNLSSVFLGVDGKIYTTNNSSPSNSGINISTDGGTSFSNKTSSDGVGSRVNGVYVGTDGKIYAATDGGLSIATQSTASTFQVSNAVAADVYEVVLVPSADACPSIATASSSVTIKSTSTSSSSLTICSSELPYNWNGLTFNAAGTQTAHLTNAVGCDSAATLTLSVTTTQITGAISGATSVCTNTSTTLTNPSMPTGGTITTSGGYRIHKFTSSGTFTVPTGFVGKVEVLVVAGGGGGGSNGGGGGGAGGVISNNTYIITGTGTTITIGGGGAASATSSVTGSNGGNSVFGTLTATGGGGGASRDGGGAAKTGGSGGGGGGATSGNAAGATAGSGTSGQGNNGGNGTAADQGVNAAGGGGGGAGTTGAAAATLIGGNGGDGLVSSITGTAVTYGGGGGGGRTQTNSTLGNGGAGGGGNGGGISTPATNGTANTGGGGGANGGSGGSGVVIVRYLDYSASTWTSSNAAIATVNTSGVVSGVSAGSVIISRKSSTCYTPTTLNITVKATSTSTTNVSICPSALPYSWNGSRASGGTYTATLINSQGCDSVATLNLTVKSNTTSTTNVSICPSALPYSWNGSRSAAGTYTFTTTNSVGCDSLATLNLTINSPTTSTTNTTIALTALPYIWNGVSYTANGTYTKNFTNGNSKGCDSTATLNLSIASEIITSSQWTWMSGDSSNNNVGVYGTKGTVAASNKPGARSSGNNWKDAAGNFWLFGGNGNAASVNGGGDLNDLWKYNTTTGQWTWVSGDSIINNAGIYGTKGTAAANNKPGSRYGSVSWTDAAGNLWLFGGTGYNSSSYGKLNDLWKYNTSTNQWTWVSGDNAVNQLPVFGTQGVAAAANKPGARNGNNVSWTDASGNLWLFGGYGYISGSNSGFLNDLWKYNISTNQWTWINGGSSGGIYGIKGTAAAINIPGSRVGSYRWRDASGNLWLFGGYGYDMNGTLENLSDLWKYNISTGQWTWVSGDNIAQQFGNYGTKGTANATNKPGARNGNLSWLDVSGSLWLFGGQTSIGGNSYFLNDLWKYNISTNQWTWVSGDNETNKLGIYGTKGTGSTNNKPGARLGNYSWIDASGSLWFFGGYGYGTSINSTASLNDLWKTAPICSGSTTTQTACDGYLWNGVSYTTSGTYTKTFTGAAGCDSLATLNLTIKNSTTSTTNVSICPSALPYSWNGSRTTAGTYTFTTTNSQGCDSVATLNLTVKANTTSTTNVSICPSALPYNWNGSRASAGTYTYTTTNSQGCDSVATLNLTVKIATTSTTTATACGSYLWNGITYTTSGAKTKTFTGGNSVGCDSVATLVLTITPNITPSVTIAANSGNSITTGTSVTFNAAPTNEGNTPAYQWKKNNNNVGTNSVTYTDATLENGDIITCVLTSDKPCASPVTVTSIGITMAVTYPCPAGTTWTSRTSAADNSWNSVTYGNGLFVAVSYDGTGNRVMTSPDGITWTSRTSAADNSWNSVTYGNGLFVAISYNGSGNRVMTSPDGITWTSRTSAADNQWISITYGNGVFVAVAISGTGNRVMTSPDGITWTIRTSAADNFWFYVTYGNGLFVAVSQDGTGNRVMTSPDGITWTSRTSAADNDWQSVTYGNGLFVAVSYDGIGNRVMTSPDGILWTSRTAAADYHWTSVTYGNGLFVAVATNIGTGNQVMTSPDGITWTSRTSAGDNYWHSVTYGNGLFVAVASDNGTGNQVMTSSPLFTTSTTNISICSSELPYNWNGSRTTAGTYTYTTTNSQGCDSVATLNLTINSATTSTNIATACGSYVWNGVTYTTSGAKTKTFTGGNSVGCDSVATLNLIITDLPTVNQPSNQVLCSNNATAPINFSGTNSNTFIWANNNTAIGLAAGGKGDIASFTALNATGITQTATITVQPETPAFAYIAQSNNVVSVINTLTNAVVASIPVGYSPTGTSISPDGTKAYVCNYSSNDLSVISTATNAVIATITCGTNPNGVATSPDGAKVYVTNSNSNNVSVIDAITNTVTDNISIGFASGGICVSLDGSKVYVVNSGSGNISVINTLTKTVETTIPVGSTPLGIAISPDGSKVFVSNHFGASVSVINTATNTVAATITVGTQPYGVTFSPDGSKVYVSNYGSANVSAINTATNTVSATFNVGNNPSGTSISPDGTSLYVTLGSSAIVNVINTATNTISNSITTTGGSGALGSFVAVTGCKGNPVNFTITVKANTTSTTNVSICPSALPYNWNGSRTIAGTYTYTTTNSQGCDSVATLNLTVKANTTSTTNVSICPSALPYSWNGSRGAAGTYTYTTTNSVGCDSVATLNLTVKANTTSTTNVSICPSALPYSWNGSRGVAGTYTYTTTNSVGCDSVATLNLTVKTTSTSTTNATICSSQLPYSWNGSRNATGTYTYTTTNSQGCDSIATLNITVKATSTSTTNTTICSTELPYSWNGLTFNEAGSQTAHITNAAGCDSAATLVLIINEPSNSNTTAITCVTQLPYNWNGTNYFSGGSYTIHLTNAGGCDSAATLNLSVNAMYSISASAGSNGSISNSGGAGVCPGSNSSLYVMTPDAGYYIADVLIDGMSYGALNQYQFINVTANHTISAIFALSCSPTISTTAISNCGSYVWGGTTYTTSGSYIKHFTNACGSDSAATLNLTINNATTSTSNVTYCNRYFWNGTIYTASGTYVYNTNNAAGCDSTAVLNLTINNGTSSTTNLAVCMNALPYNWNGTDYLYPGTYTIHLTNAAGCDSAATLNFSIKQDYSIGINVGSNGNVSLQGMFVCLGGNSDNFIFTPNPGYRVANVLVDGISIGAVSSYQFVNVTANHYVDVSFELACTPTTSTTTITACSSYLWNGNTYTSSGSYSLHFTNSCGRDSAAILNLTINQPTTSTTIVSACNSYIWNGFNYDKNGVFTQTFIGGNSSGCDSIATLKLTIKPNYSIVASAGSNGSINNLGKSFICEGSNSSVYLITANAGYHIADVLIDGVSNGAISSYKFINVTTYHTIEAYFALDCTPTASVATIAACNNYIWNGVTYTSSGTYTIHFTNARGCDSAATLNLTINQPTISSNTASVCSNQLPFSWNGLIFTAAGSQTAHFINAKGCDSAATLVLSVATSSVSTISVVSSDNNVCSAVNITFTATPTNEGTAPVYQWKKNGVAIGNGSSITFLGGTLANNDSVWCVLTSNSACATTPIATSNKVKMIIKTSPVVSPVKSNTGANITNLTMCNRGSSSTLYNTYLGGTWSSSNPAVATAVNGVAVGGASSSGLLTAVSNGTAIITYSLVTANNGCGASASLTVVVDAMPALDSITGGSGGVCIGNNIPLSNSTLIPTGGSAVWSSLVGRATINATTGVLTGVNAGIASIKYAVTNGNGCSNSTTSSVTVNSFPSVPSINYAAGTLNPQTGASGGGFCNNRTFTIVGNPTGGVWSTTNAAVVTVTSVGLVNTVGVGTGSVVYTITNANACSSSRSVIGNVVACAAKGVNANQLTNQQWTIYPNPARSFISLNVKILVGAGSIVITDLYGKQVKVQSLSMGTNTIDVSKFSKGIYLVSMITNEGKTTQKLVVE